MTIKHTNPLSLEQLRCVDAALKRALELPRHERDGWAESHFHDEPELLAALTDMLTTEQSSAAMFDAAVDERDRIAGQALIDDGRGEQVGHLVGSRIGSYRLEALIASGGMGAVYRASRADGEFDQTVAIKILPGWATDPATVSRLKAERQILSALQHPCITQLLDGGQTGDGFPYLVTEFIDGTPITEFVDRKATVMKEILELFLGVADAVQYAHDQGVIHRDLKPSNILVDQKGHPYLLDFGIAKLQEGVLTEFTHPRTATGFTPMTPEYGSPEQLSGRDVGVASDTYQLGLLLYRLLTGQQPGMAGERLTLNIAKPSTIVREQTGSPEKPIKLEIRRRVRELQGNLDTIVFKALRPDPGDRYDSVGAMAQDIRLHLANEPISARSESMSTRVWRRIQRNLMGTSLGFILLLVLLAWSSSEYFTAPGPLSNTAMPGVNPEAQRFYVRGRALLNQRSADNMPGAVLNFEQALEADPDHALAWAGLADALALLTSYSHDRDPDVLARAEKAAQRALELDPDLAEAWTARGMLEYLRHDGPAALAAYAKAIKLNPAYAHAHTLTAYQHSVLGEFDFSYASAKRAVSLDPLSPEALLNLSGTALTTGRFEEALEAARKARDMSPGWPSTRFVVAQALYYSGDFEGALNLLEGLSVPWTGAGAESLKILSLIALGRELQAREELTELRATGDIYAQATIQAALGERDNGYELLRDIEQWGEFPSIQFRGLHRQFWDPRGDDPRYQQLLRSLDASWRVPPGG